MCGLLVIVMILGNLVAAVAQDMPAPPTGQQPEIMIARAMDKDGSVVVSFSSPVLRPKSQRVDTEVDGKRASMTRMIYEFVRWNEIDVTVDEKAVKSFGIDGQEIGAKLLPARLNKATRVAVVLYAPGTEANLDSYYLEALRDDTVVFAIPLTTFYPPVPPR